MQKINYTDCSVQEFEDVMKYHNSKPYEIPSKELYTLLTMYTELSSASKSAIISKRFNEIFDEVILRKIFSNGDV